MPRSIQQTLNAIQVLSISTAPDASSATLSYVPGVATDTPVYSGNVQTGTDTQFTPCPEHANGSSVTVPMTDADTIGARKQALILAALAQEGLTAGVDRVLAA